MTDVGRRRLVMGSMTSGLVAAWPALGRGEPPPETSAIRLVRYPFDVACTAPQWVAEDLLRGEGFATVDYVKTAAAAVALGREEP